MLYFFLEYLSIREIMTTINMHHLLDKAIKDHQAYEIGRYKTRREGNLRRGQQMWKTVTLHVDSKEIV